MAAKCTKMKNARGKRAKLLIFIVEYVKFVKIFASPSCSL